MGPSIFLNTNYDFIGKRHIFLALSSVLMVVSIGSIMTKGFNFGVEFTGGAQIEADFADDAKTATPVSIESVRDAVEAAGVEGAQVVTVGGADEKAFFIKVQTREDATAGDDLGDRMRTTLVATFGEDKVTDYGFDRETRDTAKVRIEDPGVTQEKIKQALELAPELKGIQIDEVRFDASTSEHTIVLANPARKVLDALDAKFGKGTYEASIDAIGSAVSRDLQRKGFLALIAASLLVAVYVWLRFDIDFAPGVVLSLFHDAIFTMGVWSVMGFEFNLTFVAAVLALIGYSVNDTVVIYDRIRENMEKHQSKDIPWIINKSVNETLSRTLLTSFATMLSVTAIAVFGSESIRWFGWAMLIGMLSGVYSTVYVASPITVYVYEFRERQRRLQGATGPAARQQG